MALESIRNILKKPVAKIGTAIATGLFAYNLSTTDIRADSSQLEYPSAIVTSAMIAYGMLAKKPLPPTGVRIKTYLKSGSVKLVENGISEGHKFIVTPGVSISSLEGKIRGKASFEACIGGEPPDEDTEIPNEKIYHANVGVTIHPNNNDNFYFEGGVNIDRVERHGNKKYPKSFKKMNSISPEVGVGVKYKKVGAELKVNHPIWSDSDAGRLKGKLGYDLSIFYNPNDKLSFELFYKKTSFSGNENQPEHSIELTGVNVGLNF